MFDGDKGSPIRARVKVEVGVGVGVKVSRFFLETKDFSPSE